MSNKTKKFALTLGLTSDQPLNYLTTWVFKQWTESTKKLSDKLFDRSPQNLKMILSWQAGKPYQSGWRRPFVHIWHYRDL